LLLPGKVDDRRYLARVRYARGDVDCVAAILQKLKAPMHPIQSLEPRTLLTGYVPDYSFGDAGVAPFAAARFIFFDFKLALDKPDQYPNTRSNKTRTQAVVTTVQFGRDRATLFDRKP